MEKLQIIRSILFTPTIVLTEKEINDLYVILEGYVKGQYKEGIEAQIIKLQSVVGEITKIR